MIQSFQCPTCGTLNALGEPECSECGQAFVYNCPVCGSPLNNRYPTCPNCRTIFNWGTPGRIPATALNPAFPQRAPEQQDVADAPPERKTGARFSGFSARPMFWLVLVVVCAVLIAVLLIVDLIVNK